MASTTEKQPLLANYQSTTAESDDEPTLAQLRENAAKAQRDYMRAWSRSTNARLPRLLMLFIALFLTIIFSGSIALLGWDAIMDDEDTYTSSKVPLEAHIMSKCPDARDCLKDMILPAMISVSEKVDFKLSYIGNYSTSDDDVSCMHGPQECLGDIIELCAAKLYPNPRIYLGFTMCLSKSYQDIAKQELVEDCALEHGMDFDKLNACAIEDDGEHSVDMLKASFNRSTTANVTTSCTIRVAGSIFCVRDGGEWKSCPGGNKSTDLIDEINRRYD